MSSYLELTWGLFSQRKQMAGFVRVLCGQAEKWELRSQNVLDSYGQYQCDSHLETLMQELIQIRA